MNKKKCIVLILIAILFALIAYVAAQNAQDTADINNIFIPYPNLTNLAPTFEIDMPGTGERTDNETYWANDTSLELHVYAHANATSQTAEVLAYINDTLICPRSGRPLGGAETAYRGCDITIPKGTYYRVNFTNYHHYEWYEFPILAGRNGTLSVNYFNGTSNHANLTNLNWSAARHILDDDLHFINSPSSLYGSGNNSYIRFNDGSLPSVNIVANSPNGLFTQTIDASMYCNNSTCTMTRDVYNSTTNDEMLETIKSNLLSLNFLPINTVLSINSSSISHNAYAGLNNSYACFNSAGTIYNNPNSCNQTDITSGYYRQLWQKQGIAVTGSWTHANDPSQTDFASVTGEAAGVWYDSTNANNDEYAWNDIYLGRGSYNLTYVTFKCGGCGIAEFLWGTQSIGTFDTYATPAYNIIKVFSFNVTIPGKNNLRFKSSGKNALSTGYQVVFSRIQLEKTGEI